jgi:hypothetical protein
MSPPQVVKKTRPFHTIGAELVEFVVLTIKLGFLR